MAKIESLYTKQLLFRAFGTIVKRTLIVWATLACLFYFGYQLAQEPIARLIYSMSPTIVVPYEELEYYNYPWLYYKDAGDETAILIDVTLRDEFKTASLITPYVIFPLTLMIIVVIEFNRAYQLLDETITTTEQLSDVLDDLNLQEQRIAPYFSTASLDSSLTPYERSAQRIFRSFLHKQEALDSATVRKDELVAYLAHDLRSPLTSIIGYLSLLENPQKLDAEAIGHFAHAAEVEAERMNQLLGKLFEISRYNLHDLELEREQVALKHLFMQVVDELTPLAETREVSFELKLEDIQAFVDAEELARAITNIVQNAVSYAARASTIAISLSDKLDMIEIVIQNSGKEISAAHLEHIFEKFYRADASRNTALGGSGLGLAIAKEVVEAHGGTIGCTSNTGITTFTVMLPKL